MKNVTYGGSMIRDIGGFPGMLENFVTVTRRYTKTAFNKHSKAMSEAFSHVNFHAIEDDHGTEWGRGELLHLGSDGKDYGSYVLLVHKFLPIEKLYTAVPFEFLAAGKAVE